jgi:putative peptide zinc metalloprotease protein
VHGESVVRFRQLSMRPDADGWVIGRVETGDFISVPAVAYRVITLLDAGHPIAHVAAALRAETGTDLAVGQFTADLDELGFIAEVDGQTRADRARPRPSLPWIRPPHVRWLLHPVVAWAAAGVALAVTGILVTHPGLIPSYRNLAWSRHAGLAIGVDAAIAWTLAGCHELGHLATARATGAGGRISLTTRLQFLAFQTDVSGVWAAPRRNRMTVYLAGMTVDLCNALVCLLLLAFGDPHGLARQLLAVACTEILLAIPLQFMVFMRTDVYFVLQDLTGCANLYADGSAYLRYLIRHHGRPDPTVACVPRQRRAVRAYSALLVVGTVACLGVEAKITAPALIVMLARAIGELGHAGFLGRLDGGVALAVLLTWQGLWLLRWWQRHAPQVRRILCNGRR